MDLSHEQVIKTLLDDGSDNKAMCQVYKRTDKEYAMERSRAILKETNIQKGEQRCEAGQAS